MHKGGQRLAAHTIQYTPLMLHLSKWRIIAPWRVATPELTESSKLRPENYFDSSGGASPGIDLSDAP